MRQARPPALIPTPKSRSMLAGPGGHAGDAAALDRSRLGSRAGAGAGPQFASQPAHSEVSAAAHREATNAASATASDEHVVRAGGSMAIATLISRITGFLRTVLIGSALGPAVASAFNTANTLPNLITELVLGAVLTSLVVPVLVRAEKEDPDGGATFIRRLLTVTFTLTIVVTVLAVLSAPLLVRMSLGEDGQVNVAMSATFGYLVLPQIVFYAMFAVFMAVLNTKGIFRPGAWAPVVNNVVTLAVLSLYYVLPPDMKLHPTDSVTILDAPVLLLGLGTTAGVVMQALIMIPALRRAGIDLRPLWGIDARLRSFGGMAVAIVVYVAISQLGWILNNRIASMSSAEAPTIYTQAWQLLQVPYGVIGVTLLTAVMPRLSRNAADGDDRAVVKDLTVATKLTLLALIPIITFFTAFGTLIAGALFFYGNYPLSAANVLGWTVSFSAFALIPYAIVLLHLRVFYAREEVWTPTFIIAGITITKLALAFTAPLIATEPRLVVVLLGAANGFGFLAGAIIGERLLRRSLGSLQFRAVFHTSAWALGASAVGALVAWQADLWLTRLAGLPPENPWFVLRLAVTGVLFLAVTGAILSRSRLEEVTTIGHALGRVPLLRRFIGGTQGVPQQPGAHPGAVPGQQAAAGGRDAVAASAGGAAGAGSGRGASGPADPAGAGQLAGGMTGRDVRAAEPLASVAAAAAQEVAHESTLAATLAPALPPLSAGRVRGPRLVPGAPVLGGRYRLLAEHSPRAGSGTAPQGWAGAGVDDHATGYGAGVPGGQTPVGAHSRHSGEAASGEAANWEPSGTSAAAASPASGRHRAPARLWQAREMPDGDVVALTIIDVPAAARAAGLDSERAKAQIVDATEALRGLSTPGLARIRDIVDAGSSVIVVADWVPGSAISVVSEADPDPLAAGYAVADVAEAVARTHAHGCVLGLDSPARVRISADGVAVLAFPGVLPTNTAAQDSAGIPGTLEELLCQVPADDIPEELAQLYTDMLDAGPSSDSALMARRLRDLSTGELHVETEATPNPDSRAGFGAAVNKPRSVAMAGLLAFVAVVLVAAVIAGLVALLGGQREDSPLSPESIRQGAATAAKSPVVALPLAEAREWLPTDGRGTLDTPEQARLIVDGQPGTLWRSDTYNNPLGTGPGSLKFGIGLLVTPPNGAEISTLRMSGLQPGMQVEVRRLAPGGKRLADSSVLALVDVTDPTMAVNFGGASPQVVAGQAAVDSGLGTPAPGVPAATGAPTAPAAGTGSDLLRLADGEQILLWITRLPPSRTAQLGEVELFGRLPGAAPGSTPAPAPGAGATSGSSPAGAGSAGAGR